MKRASYRHAVRWIASNDSSGDEDALEVGEVSFLTSVVLIAEIFDTDSEKVARDVVRARKRELKACRARKRELKADSKHLPWVGGRRRYPDYFQD
jgi:hypothetical protein